ncbi:MAG: hypothetical protein Q7T38_06585 [Gallionella sp.]|nr:hypothetical protein [Gallionella sp.]
MWLALAFCAMDEYGRIVDRRHAFQIAKCADLPHDDVNRLGKVDGAILIEPSGPIISSFLPECRLPQVFKLGSDTLSKSGSRQYSIMI